MVMLIMLNLIFYFASRRVNGRSKKAIESGDVNLIPPQIRNVYEKRGVLENEMLAQLSKDQIRQKELAIPIFVIFNIVLVVLRVGLYFLAEGFIGQLFF